MTSLVLFRREVLPPRKASDRKPKHPASAVPLVLGVVVMFSAIVSVVWPTRRIKVCSFESTVDITRMTIKDYTESAFVMWQRNNEDRVCPRDLAELNEYTNRQRTHVITDAWGSDLRMSCNSRGLRVWSLGEDGRPETADDVRSWE